MYKVCKVALIGKSCMSKFNACLFPTLARSLDQGQGHVTLFLSKVTWPWPWSRDLDLCHVTLRKGRGGGGRSSRSLLLFCELSLSVVNGMRHFDPWPFFISSILLCFRVKRGYSYVKRLFNNFWKWVFKKYIFFHFFVLIFLLSG